MIIKIANETDRLTVAAVLVKNGYCVHQGKITVGKKSVAVLVVEDTKNVRGEANA